MRRSDLVTYLSIAFGLLSFHAVLSGERVLAGLFLLLSLAADYLDGRVARYLGEADRKGMFLDSLADSIVFGAIPVGMALSLAREWPVLLAGTWYVCAGCFRLVRFMSEKREGYLGMPITMNAVGVSLVLVLSPSAPVFTAYFVLSGLLMVSRVQVPKL